MAFYEYKCSECGHAFDAEYPMGKQPKLEMCPKCGNVTAKRVFSAIGILKSLFSGGDQSGGSSCGSGGG